jgi:hypothetical protein
MSNFMHFGPVCSNRTPEYLVSSGTSFWLVLVQLSQFKQHCQVKLLIIAVCERMVNTLRLSNTLCLAGGKGLIAHTGPPDLEGIMVMVVSENVVNNFVAGLIGYHFDDARLP